MTETWQCPGCGARIDPSVWPDDSCPRCMLGAARGNELAPDPGSDASPDELKTTVAAEFMEDGADRIRDYRLLQELGAGGMGEVWEAEQERPVRRKVALKLIKAGMDTRQVVARFESERQALALMNHPNIAQVFDAGRTEQGRPYFAMELVRGEPITAYCDRHRLTTRERLELFTQVCEGVQHAHQKGVIHRDLKPSNVLVTIQDDKPVPKIIDFGVAKATQQRLTERTMVTQLGVLIGTPEYMSPEQAELTGLDIDTRTDVYALGVILYELLVGALPFDPKGLRQAGFDELRRRIREEEPSKPSTRVSTLGEASTETAKRRRTDLPTLRRQLRGDLDWITMKALEKDRTRRYGSPSELVADIRRHLAHEPVLAGPPSAVYRTKKFVRRHRVGATVAAVVVVLLVGFAARERIQASRIAREAATAEQVSAFLVDMFKVSDPSQARGETITAREILDQGAERIERELGDQPAVQARLMQTMGDVYISLGLYADAAPLLERALEIQTRLFGSDHVQTVSARQSLAALCLLEGRSVEAEALLSELLPVQRRTLGNEHPDTLASMTYLADAYASQARYTEAEPLRRETLEIKRRVLGEEHPDTHQSANALAESYRKQGRYAEAEELLGETLEIQRRVLGEEHPATLSSMNHLALTHQLLGHRDEAETLLRETLEIQHRVLGPEHPRRLASASNLANWLHGQGRYAESLALHRETLDTRRRVLGEEHPATLTSVRCVAKQMLAQGRYGEAEALMIEVLEVHRRVKDFPHPSMHNSMHVLATAYRKQGRYAEAEALSIEALEGSRRVMDREHKSIPGSMRELAVVFTLQGRYEEALSLLEEALESSRRNRGEGHPSSAEMMSRLGFVYSLIGGYDAAEPLLVQALETRRRVFGANHPDSLRTTAALGDLHRRQHRFAESEILLRGALEGRREVLEPQHPDIGQSLFFLGCLAAAQGQRDDALDLFRQALDQGWAERWILDDDPDLVPLRGDPRFKAIVAEVKQRIETE